MRKKIDYIDGLKGIGCMMVMAGHYYCICSLAEKFITVSPILEVVFKLFGFFLNPDLGLLIFAVLSGYCIAMTPIRTIWDLVFAVIKRFLRFFIPVLGANLIIYGIYKTIGFYNGATISLFENAWFQNYYQIEMWFGLAVRDSMNTVIGNGALFNSSFWIIKPFFYTSLLVYLGNYIESKNIGNFKYLLYLVELVIAARLFSTNGIAIIFGVLWSKAQGCTWWSRTESERIAILSCVVTFVLLSGGAEIVDAWLQIQCFSNVWIKIFCVTLLLCEIGRVELLKKGFSAKGMKWLNKISFGIYALHWPIMCSISSLLFLKMEFHIGSYLLIGMLSFGIVILLAVLYHFTVEKVADIVLMLLNEVKKRCRMRNGALNG